MLTEKQYNLLMYINKVNRETGQCPSFDEMKDAIGLKSKSGIHALINSLEERNFIRKLPHKARALEVIRLPRFKPQAIIDEEKSGSRLYITVRYKFRCMVKLLPVCRLKLWLMNLKQWRCRLIWCRSANIML